MNNFSLSCDFMATLLNKVDIVDVIGGRIDLKKSGDDFIGLCPFHKEGTPSFYVDPVKQAYYCFGCSSGGNVINFLMDFENLCFADAVAKVAECSGFKIENNNTKNRYTTSDIMPEIVWV
jgi:DNA primase